MRSTSLIPSDHARRLLVLVAASRLLLDTFLVLLSFLPLFDSSSTLILGEPQNILSRVLSTTLRWDSIHFLSVAEHGYIYESQWAWFPGVPVLSRVWTLLRPLLPPSSQTNPKLYYLFTGALAVRLIDGTFTLYTLTLRHFNSTSVALLTALLSLMPSSPATLRHAPYAEPMFTYLSYKGMLYCTYNKWLYASIMFALAGLFRSNGILLGGYVIWGLLVEPFFRRRMITYTRVLHCASLVLLIFSPFLIHQYIAYRAFCLPASYPASLPSPPPAPAWCSRLVPSIYSHVQSTYWNVGFLKYWTWRQIPNFLISIPVLSLILISSTSYLVKDFFPDLRSRFFKGQAYPSPYPPHPPSPWVDAQSSFMQASSSSAMEHSPSSASAFNNNHNQPTTPQNGTVDSSNDARPPTYSHISHSHSRSTSLPPPMPLHTPFFPPSIAPHAIHALFFTLTLLFAAHTQIVLRLAASMPFTYWSATRLWVEHPRLARLWTLWSLGWGGVSLVLWVAFLPPA